MTDAFPITEPKSQNHMGRSHPAHCLGPRDDPPCDREWFLNGQGQPQAGQGRAWQAALLAPGHTAASQDQAMAAGYHISQPSRWVRSTERVRLVTDVVPLEEHQCGHHHGGLCLDELTETADDDGLGTLIEHLARAPPFTAV
jgi:hypothetical protein